MYLLEHPSLNIFTICPLFCTSTRVAASISGSRITMFFNGVALIRGIGYALAFTPHFTALSMGTALCSAIGIYCSTLILKQNAKGFSLAKRKAWFVAAHETIAIHLSHNGTTIQGVVVTIGAFASAALLYKLFSSPEAKQYSNQVELSAKGT